MDDIQRNEKDNSRTVLVSGIDKDKTDLVHMFLENKKRSGGGITESFVYDESTKTAMVTFEEREGF